MKDQAGNHLLFIAAITSKEPTTGRQAISVPETEVRRANLDRDVQLWVMIDELNADVLEKSYNLEDCVARGQFSQAFTDKLIRAVQEVRAVGALRLSKRT